MPIVLTDPQAWWESFLSCSNHVLALWVHWLLVSGLVVPVFRAPLRLEGWVWVAEMSKDEGPHFLVVVPTVLSFTSWPHMLARALDSSVLTGGCGAGGQEAGSQRVAGRFCTIMLMALASVARQEEPHSKKIDWCLCRLHDCTQSIWKSSEMNYNT